MIFDSEIGKGTTAEIVLPVQEKNNILKGIIE